MKKENRKNKILYFLKISSNSLFDLWIVSRPKRYSEDQSGLNSWKEDVSRYVGASDEKTLEDILRGIVEQNIASKAEDWSIISSIFPEGEEIRKLWKKQGEKSLSSFLNWLKLSNLNDSKLIIAKMKELSPPKIEEKKRRTVEPSELPPPKDPGSENKKSKVNYDLKNVSDEEFYRAILRGIGAPETKNNIAYLLAWRQAEGGRATFNPFNTTQKAEGATNYNKVGVKNYISAEQGIKATVKTLLNGRYENIISSLKRDASPMETAEALVASPWGTGDLVKKVISGYEAGYPPKSPQIATA